MECAKCSGPIVGSFLATQISIAAMAQRSGDIADNGFLLNFWPKLDAAVAPKHTPDKIAEIFVEGEEARRAGRLHSAGMGLGKALDVAIKKIDPSLRGALGVRLDQLAARGQLTKELVAWCQTIRPMRNDAMHEEDAFKADELASFSKAIELIFMYLFTLPGILEEMKT
ncbi:hypothetical protein LMIY3S_03666 [Labrys miyagiensis]